MLWRFKPEPGLAGATQGVKGVGEGRLAAAGPAVGPLFRP